MPLFAISPEVSEARPKDLRLTRPYFIAPLDPILEGQAGSDHVPLDEVRCRIKEWAERTATEPTSVLLRLADVPDPALLVEQLNASGDPVSRHIKRLISCDTQRLLDLTRRGFRQSSLGNVLIDELNALLKGECLYNEKAFAGDRLSEPDRQAVHGELARNPKGSDLLRLNRRLLELAYPQAVIKSPPKGKVTDVCILSHGWHRNFFSAVGAYDKLMSGLSVLLHRERLKRPQPYHPLFINLHWHSDPGQNEWEDKQGRRHLASFLANVERTFERPPAQVERHQDSENRFTSVFEDIFQLFSRMSAPGTPAFHDDAMKSQAQILAEKLDGFYLRDAASAEFDAKVSAVWACYHQALPRGVVLDQSDPPGEAISFPRASYNFWRFVFKAVGLVTLLGLLSGWLPQCVAWLSKAAEPLSEALWGQPWAAPLVSWSMWFQGHWFLSCLAAVGGLFLLSLVILHLAKWLYRAQESNRPGHGVSVLFLAAWACAETVCALPLLLYLLFTYFTGWMYPNWGLFPERFEPEGQRKINKWLFPRYGLAVLARYPVKLLRGTLSKDSWANGFVDFLDGQLAFWEMQISGVETGARAAEFLAQLFQDLELSEVRIHFVGHSFGSLVIANAVRHLALEKKLRDKLARVRPIDPDGKPYQGGAKINTLWLLQGAMASAWFKKEHKLLDFLCGSLACIYSRYDTANGIYYPVSNHGRLAAGYVGLYKAAGLLPTPLPDGRRAEDLGRFASLTEPPDLNQLLKDRYSVSETVWILNLDASRMIYDGPVVEGGGHGDIYKPDVLHLIWAITRLYPPGHPGTPAAAEPLAQGHAH